MKNLAFTSIFLIIAAASLNAQANQMPHNAGGFNGPTSSQMPTTAKQAVDSNAFSDDTPIVLTGKIVKSLGGEMYTFRDSSGDVTVEIDHDEWYGLKVDPTTTVVIHGEIDKEYGGTKIDVKRIMAK